MDFSKFITPEMVDEIVDRIPPEVMKEVVDRLNTYHNQMNSRTGIVQSPELWATETDPEMFIEGDILIDVKWIGDKWVPVH